MTTSIVQEAILEGSVTRASMTCQSRSSWIAVYVALTVLVGGLPLIESYTSIDTGRLGQIALIGQLFTLWMAIRAYDLRDPMPGWRGYTGISLSVLVFMLIFGVVSGNRYSTIWWAELPCYLATIGGFWIGRHDQVWTDLRWPTVILIGALLALSIVSTDIDAIVKKRDFTEVPSYRVQGALLLLLPVVAGAAEKGGSLVVFGVLAGAGQLMLMIAFAKRAPSVRVVIMLVIVLCLAKKMARFYAGIAIVLVMVVVSLSDTDLLSSLDQAAQATIARFSPSARTGGQEITFGESNDRLYEGILCTSTLEPIDWAIGRGLGGYYRGNPRNVESVVDNYGAIHGQSFLHMGALLHLVKGGLIWTTLYFLPAALYLGYWFKGNKRDQLTRAAGWGLLVYLAFSFMEGAPLLGYNTQNSFVFGLLCSRAQNLQASGVCR